MAFGSPLGGVLFGLEGTVVNQIPVFIADVTSRIGHLFEGDGCDVERFCDICRRHRLTSVCQSIWHQEVGSLRSRREWTWCAYID